MWMIDLLKKLFIKFPDIQGFMDIGSNIGQTLIKLKSVNAKIPYIGFDPNPQCVAYVQRLIHVNRWSNTHVVALGISDHNHLAKLQMYTPSITDKAASIIQEFRRQTIYEEFFVPVFDFETIYQSFDKFFPGIIKIDVEGAEWYVLKSFNPYLEKHKPLILIEILPVYNEQNKSRLEIQNKIESLLKQSGYEIYRIEKKRVKFMGLVPLDRIGIHDRLDWTDYLLIHSSQRDFIKDLISRD